MPRNFDELKTRIRGPVVGLLTPFAADGAVDFNSLPGYVEHQLAAGLDVLAFSPMVSSLCVLTADETRRLAVEVKRIAGDRACVLASTRSDSPTDTFDLLRGLEDGGLDGAFVFPGYLGPKPQVYIRLLEACGDVTSMPLLGFQVSVEQDRRFGGLPWMDLDHWQRLAERPQIVGLKDDTGNLEVRRGLVARFGGRFAIVGPGMADRYLQVHDSPGQAELTSIGYLDAGDERRARAIMDRALDCIRQVADATNCGWGIEPIQMIAHVRGWLASPTMRPPLPTPSPAQIDAVRCLVDAYDAAQGEPR